MGGRGGEPIVVRELEGWVHRCPANDCTPMWNRGGTKTPYAGPMASKSKPTGESKKPGRSLKEKRAAKHQKQAEQKQSRKGWEAK